MSAGNLTRNFTMSDADLIQYAFNLVGYITRDAAGFIPYGVSAPEATALHNLVIELSEFPTDEEFIGDVGIATEDKNAKAEELRNSIRSLAVRAENKWGVNSSRYKKYGVSGLARLNDRDLYVCGKRVHHVSTGFLTLLASEGLVQTILDDFADLVDEFESKLFDLNEATALRDQNTEDRIELANNLYSFVVKYTNFGKLIWANTSEALYNDYVIYTVSSPGTLTAPTGFAFDFMTLTFSWNEVQNSTSYLIESSVDGIDYSAIYSGSDLSFYYEPPVEGIAHYRIRARSSIGLGPESLLQVDYQIILQPPTGISATITNAGTHTIALNWDDCNHATSYKLYRSSVVLGAPAAVFDLVGEYTVTHYVGAQTANMRHYFHIVSCNDTQTSEPGMDVFIEV